MKLIYTIGHSNKDAETFVNELLKSKIEVLVDIRHFPHSPKHPHFDIAAFPKMLTPLGIQYVHLEGLGGRRKSTTRIHTALTSKSFQAYADHMDTDIFKADYKKLQELALTTRVAYMCAEVLFWNCHRKMLSDRLVADGWKVLHLGINSYSTPEHKIWEYARKEEKTGRLIYDVQKKSQKPKKPAVEKRKLNKKNTSKAMPIKKKQKQEEIPDDATIDKFFGLKE